MSRLTNRKKNWLFYNLKRFHSEDQYLKYLNNKIILSTVRYKIHKSFTVEDLYKELSSDMFTQEFSFYRKEDKYFSYPSLRDQVMSLLECWEELRGKYQSLQKGNESEYEQSDDEPFSDHKIIDTSKIKRNVFGNKLNVNSIPHLKEDATFFKHVMSSNKYIKSSFGFEYHCFKKRCLNELKKVEDRTKLNSYFFQTDLKSFFHRLKPSTILKIIKIYKLKNTEKWITDLVSVEKGLPIGWMLSGIISDLIMMEFSKFITNNHDKLIKELGVTKLEMISYVDDLIFFIGKKDQVQDKIKFIDELITTFQKYLDEFFEGSKIEIYGHDSHKVKFIPLDKALASILRTNWHDIDVFVSGDENDLTKDWSVLDDFLLPSDNDLILNEKVQFFNNLKNLKSRIANDEITTSKEFEPYLDKILYKISIEKKYLASVFDVFFTFLQKNKLKDTKEFISTFWDKLASLSDLATIDIIQFIIRYHRYHTENDEPRDSFLEMLSSAVIAIQNNKKFDKSDDKVLFETFVRLNFMDFLEELSFIKKKNQQKYYFHISSGLFVRYSKLISTRKDGADVLPNPFLCSEIIQIYFKNKIKTSEELIRRIRNITLLIENKKKRREFIEVLFDDFAFEIIPFLNKESLYEIVDFLDENDVQSELSHEIKNIYLNYDQLFAFFLESRLNEFNNFVESLNNITNYKYKKPKSLKFEILKPENGKLYVFYKEIVTCMLFSMSSVTDALKFVFFQYKPIESNVFISWKALPYYFNGVSNFSLALTKEFFKQNISGLIKEKPELTRKVAPSQFLSLLKKRVENQLSGRLKIVDLDTFDKLIAGDSKEFERFKKNKIKLMISNVEINILKDLSPQDNYRLKADQKNRVHWQIMNSLREAVLRKCDVVCFPELTMPITRLGEYLDFAGRNKLIIIGGTEYIDFNSSSIGNPSIISFPTEKNTNPLSRSYHAFVQFKNFISIKEFDAFAEMAKSGLDKVEIVEGREVLIFNDLNVNKFSILSCSDFLSLELKYHLQGEVQTVFVPAMNFDNTTYYHVAQAAIRELYCICVICNNSFMGSSLVCAPFRKESERTIFKIEGKSKPKAHHLTIRPSIISELQELATDKFLSFEENKQLLNCEGGGALEDYKQTPPDWHCVRKNLSNK